MNTSEHTRTAFEAAMPQEVASAVNLFAHPLAGAAAMSALGFGLASHALGLWAGAVAGAAEASQRMLLGTQPAARPAKAGRGALKLVVSQPMPEAGPVRNKPAGPQMVAPASEAKPGAPDDLKSISGIGPKLETVLNGLGIWSYRQIAGLGEKEIAWLDDRLGFAGRIGRDDWVGQAKALSASAG